ncbi:unnamed protein product [Pleuronectes platessa]|uniref:Neural chondroitin sulphate proteoglycan cytoplasmic domain-containing protein n=1 Tax=Pleuronectes platessa TaxID=8262 RepID=A0A9N7VGQ7_PLEPL|nr:unnamed protein product [Pleuronectes platessa]
MEVIETEEEEDCEREEDEGGGWVTMMGSRHEDSLMAGESSSVHGLCVIPGTIRLGLVGVMVDDEGEGEEERGGWGGGGGRVQHERHNTASSSGRLKEKSKRSEEREEEEEEEDEQVEIRTNIRVKDGEREERASEGARERGGRDSKYRPSSEQHNDNFSLSTIAEGSHPNVRKLCDTPPNVPHARALAYYDNIICQRRQRPARALTRAPFYEKTPTVLCGDPLAHPLLSLNCSLSPLVTSCIGGSGEPTGASLTEAWVASSGHAAVVAAWKTMSRYTWECKTKEESDCERIKEELVYSDMSDNDQVLCCMGRCSGDVHRCFPRLPERRALSLMQVTARVLLNKHHYHASRA